MLALAVAFAPEIGLGFSPDTPNGQESGFSPWDMQSTEPRAIPISASIDSSDTTYY
jgi:hypothetical protein